jgi:hypothetical protein
VIITHLPENGERDSFTARILEQQFLNSCLLL